MQTTQLQSIARLAGVFEAGHPASETDLIRAIQTIRNHAPCFRSEVRYTCTSTSCEWRQECKRLVAEWRF